MPREIARRLIGGIWRTVDVDESVGPGGGVSEVVADDASIVVSNGTGPVVGLSAPGGSVPGSAQWIDLGTVSVDDVLTGPTTIYTPAADSFVTDIRILDGFTVTDDGNGITLGIFSGTRFGPVAFVANSAGDTKDLNASGLNGIGVLAAGAAIGDTGAAIALTLPDDPLILALTAHDTGEKPAVAWTALTAKDGASGLEENVIGDGHLWFTGDAGDTGASEPDWAANFGGTVVDGDLTWSDIGALPTAGEAHVLICVTTPDTP